MLIMKMNVSTHKMNSQQQQNGHPQACLKWIYVEQFRLSKYY